MDGRDRYVDLVRAVSILAVVFGHWLIADLDWQDRLVRGRSALGAWPALWPLTWVLQVMGLFFFVGGFANRRSWESGERRGEGYAAFLDRRLWRLLVPAGVFLAVVTVGGLGLQLVEGGVAVGSMLTRPLWFVSVYLVVVALTPLTLRWHRRAGWEALAVLLVLVVAADAARIGLGLEWVALVNVLLVWGAAHQLGYLWSEGALTRRVAGWLLGGGLLAVTLLTALGPYPARMVGVRGDDLVNAHPPTLALAALVSAQIGLAVLLHDVGARVVARDRWWHPVVAVNLVIMTIFVWHEPAMAIAARVGFPLGLPHPPVSTGRWFAARALLMAAAAATLAGLVALFGRFEAQRHPPAPSQPGPRSTVATVTAVVLVAVGFLAAAGTNVLEPIEPVELTGWLAVPPIAALALVGAGGALLWTTSRTRGRTSAG